MLTTTVCNLKGGVGKSACTLGLASSAAAAGLRTLVIDCDPQGNTSQALGVQHAELTTFDVLHAAATGSAREAIIASGWPGVAVIPADEALTEKNRDASIGGEMALREALTGVTDWDLILIDTPPSVERLTHNALNASDKALVVTMPTAFSLEGVSRVLTAIRAVRMYWNQRLDVAGVIVNGVPPRSREATLRLGELRAELGPDVWEPVIPRRQVVEDAMGAQAPLSAYGRDSRDVTAVFDILLARLMWNDSSYRAAHPDRDPRGEV